MTLRIILSSALLSAFLAGPTLAQTNTLRGLSDATPNRLPSAGQQLNQNLNRQQSDFSTRQRIEGANDLNRTNQINRLNTQSGTSGSNCPSANAACNQGR
ncbi:hypothetical protein [Roseibium sp.]|uniref:hypothetical protein n=1 Tax=Roseibium sp. TaxID=1936156 RepID=UPI003BB06090